MGYGFVPLVGAGAYNREAAGRARVFTEYVRAVDAHGEVRDAGLFQLLWQALRAALAGELKRRGLWESPPSYLGIYGWERWEPSPAQGSSAGLGTGPLEELLAECYTFIFVDRLRSLQAQLKVKENVDGLVFLDIRHFLHERQKENDPVGSRVFEVLQSAVRRAVEAGELLVLAGDPRVRNDTWLAFDAGAEAEAAPEGVLRGCAERWADDLLPDLLTVRGRAQEEIVERLRRRLPDLREAGVEAFRFKDLVGPLKADVRARWAAVLEASEPGMGLLAEQEERVDPQRIRPDRRFEERQTFRALVACVLEALERLEVGGRTRGQLSTLWEFLRVRAAGPAGWAPGSRLARDPALRADLDEEGPLSHRRLAELLRLPRERIPDHLATLGRLVEGCRAAEPGKASVTGIKEDFGREGSRRGPM